MGFLVKQHLDLPDPFEAHIWVDPVLELAGVDLLGPYPEVYWLPHIGPSSLWVARRLVMVPGTWDKVTLAAAMGLGHTTGRNSTLERSLARLVGFRVAQEVEGVLHVRRHWPRVPANLLAKMPPELRSGEAGMARAA